MPERRAGDVVRVEERVVRALGLLPPEEPAVLGGREGLAQRRAKGVHVGELARRGGRKAHEVLGPRGAAGGVCEEDTTDAALQLRGEVELDELIQSLDRKPNKTYENRYWGDPGFIHLCFDIWFSNLNKGSPITLKKSPFILSIMLGPRDSIW